jgi:predicted signal transduction protein with EAL and GGDEF domain
MFAWPLVKARLPLLQAGAFVALSALVAAAGYAFVQRATDRLLERQARSDASHWVEYLSLNVPGLYRIGEGGQPSVETLNFIDKARSASHVLGYRVYDPGGYLKLRSGDASHTLGYNQLIYKLDPEFADAISGKEAVTIVLRGSAIGEPAYFTSTLVPIMHNGLKYGWLVADIDQTDRQANFMTMATQVSVGVGLMLAVAPLIGFIYRSRQKRETEQRLHDITRRDPLTGVLNRSTFQSEVEKFLEASPLAAAKSALIAVELSDLPTIDEDFGLQAAEAQLIAAALRLTHTVPIGSKIGRLDTARFGIFIEDAGDPMATMTLTRELTTKLSEPVEIGTRTTLGVAHAGIAMTRTDGPDANTLIRSAELALRAAQKTPGISGYGFFNPEAAHDARRRAAVQRAVAEAAANSSFRLDFQPLYSIRNGELWGFEALIRLHDPELGPVSPAEFIPVAEQMGLITKIGAWCLQEACRVAADWPPHLVVAVNLSPEQFYTGTLLADIQHALLMNRFPSYRLEVEITEGTMLKDSDVVMEQLRALRELGLSIALDDFGTGYSSLSYLWKFPFSKLKIDRSFINALDESQNAKGILRSIIKLGHGLGFTVTAEGIETSKQFNTLRELGCDLAQGYLMDRPARIEDLAAIIMRNFAKGLQRRMKESDRPTDGAAPKANAAG